MKNRSNIAASILMNPEMLENAYTAVNESAGSAQKELDKYLDSINGKTMQLKNQIQEILFNLVDSGAIKSVLDFLKNVLELVGGITGKLGSLGTILTGSSLIVGLKSAASGQPLFASDVSKTIKNFNEDQSGVDLDQITKTDQVLGKYLTDVSNNANGATASLGGYIKALIKTGVQSKAAAAKQILLKGAMTALGGVLVGLGAMLVKNLIENLDEVINKEEHLREQVSESVEAYDQLKTELDDINQKLIDNKSLIDEIKSKGTITLFDQQESDKLKSINEQLMLSKKLAETNLRNSAYKKATDTIDLMRTYYPKGGAAISDNPYYYNDLDTYNMEKNVNDKKNINNIISTWKYLQDYFNENLSEGYQDYLNGNEREDNWQETYQIWVDCVRINQDNIDKFKQQLLDYSINLADAYSYAVQTDEAQRTTSEKEIIEYYEKANKTLKTIDKYVNPSEYYATVAKAYLDLPEVEKYIKDAQTQVREHGQYAMSPEVKSDIEQFAKDQYYANEDDINKILPYIFSELNQNYFSDETIKQKTLSSWLEDENVSKLISDYENKVLNPISSAMEKFKDSSENYTWSKLITDFPEIAEYMDEGDDFFDSAYTYLQTKYSELKDKLDANELEVADYDAFMEGLNQRGLQTLGATDNSEQLIANYKELIDVQETLAAGGKVEEMRMNKLIQKYPDLASSIKYTTDGYVLYDDVVRDAINTQATEANKSISSMVIYTQNMIELKLAEVKALNISTNAWETYWHALLGRGQEFYQNSAGILQMITENNAEARKYVSELQGSGAHYNEAELVQMVLAKFDPSGALSVAAQYQEDLLKLLENQRDAVGAGNKAKADAEDSLGQVDNLANYLDRLNREVERLQTNLENTNGLDNQIAASKDYIKALKSEISVMQEATNEYEKRFKGENVAIDGVVYNLRKEYGKAQSEAKGNKGPSYNKLVELISSGKRVDITQFDSNVAGVINNIVSAYQQWQDEITQITEKQRTLREEITKTGERVVAQFEKITSEYENRQNVIEALMNNPDKMDNVNYYKALIENEVNATATIYRERNRLVSEYNDLITKGVTKSGFESLDEAMKDSTFADGVYNLKGQIDELNVSIIEAENQTREWLQAMNQARWDLFDRINDQINSVIDETEYLVERLQSNKELFTEEGILNPEGLATFGLYETQLEVHRNNIERVQAEIDTLNQMITDDPTNTTLLDRRKEMIDLYHEETSAIDDTKESIISLVQDGFDKELDSLQKIIDKYKEALNSEKNLYDYQKNISSKTKDIAKLRKQIEAYANDTSEEARAKVQQLSVSLSDAQEDLRDTQYDRYISDQENILDELYTSYEKYLNDAIKDTDNILKGVGAKVDDNTTKISETINGLGVTVSDTLTNILAVPINGIESAISNNDLNVELLKESVLGISGDLKQYLQNYDITLDDTTLAKNVSGMFAAISQLNTNVDTIFKDQTLASSLKAISNIAEKWGKSEADATVSNAIDNPVGYNNATMNAVQSVLGKISDFNNKILSDNVDIKAVKWKDGRWEAYTDSFPESAVADTKAEAIAALKKKMKKANAYAVGSKKILDDEWAWTQENGNEIIMRPSDGAILTPLAKGDSVLTSAASENLWNMANDPTKFIKAYSAPKIIGTTRAGNVTNEVHMSITLPNVTNYTEFVTQLQKDKRFESMIQDMTVNQLTNAGSLAKFKYKF